jgi:hypothetical protein
MIDETFGANYCGGYTYELEYLDGPFKDQKGLVLSTYTQFVEEDKGIVTYTGISEDANWIGVHYMSIKSTLGSKDTSTNARGVKGLYNSYSSEPFSVIVSHNCDPIKFIGYLIRLDDVLVGDRAFEIPLGFDQYPCDFKQEFTYNFFNRNSGD